VKRTLILVACQKKNIFFDFHKNEVVSQQVYEHSISVFSNFNCKSVREYLKLFMTTQVVLLTDVATHFANEMQRQFSLSVWHSNTIHSYNFDCFSSSLGPDEVWENIRSVEMLKFVSAGVYGGLVSCNIRYCESNNEYCMNFNGNSEERTHILNMDCVASYGSCALFPLGHRNMRFLSDEEVKDFPLSLRLKHNDKKRYLFQVSVRTPVCLHKEFTSLPVTFSKRKVNLEELSEEQRSTFHSLHPDFVDNETNEMLLLDLTNKYGIVVYSEMLRY
jgi:hypothetical protein